MNYHILLIILNSACFGAFLFAPNGTTKGIGLSFNLMAVVCQLAILIQPTGAVQ